MSFLVDIVQFAVSAPTGAVFLILAVVLFIGSFWIPAVICLLLFAVYAVMVLRSGQTVRISGESVERRFLGVPHLSFQWTEIREVGIVGTKVLNRGKPNRTGAKYIYFSTHTMTEDERFGMCLEWPPKDIIYIRYNEKCAKYVMQRWQGEPVLYNTGKLQL